MTEQWVCENGMHTFSCSSMNERTNERKNVVNSMQWMCVKTYSACLHCIGMTRTQVKHKSYFLYGEKMSDDAFLAITIRIERCKNSICILALCIQFGYSQNAMNSKGGQMHCNVQSKSKEISNHKRKTKNSLSSFPYSLSCLMPCSFSVVVCFDHHTVRIAYISVCCRS